MIFFDLDKTKKNQSTFVQLGFQGFSSLELCNICIGFQSFSIK